MRSDAIEVEVWSARWPLGAPHNIQRYGPQRFRVLCLPFCRGLPRCRRRALRASLFARPSGSQISLLGDSRMSMKLA